MNLRDPSICERFVKESFREEPDRLRHILVMADMVRQSARDLNEISAGQSADEQFAFCAALLHDIGYLPKLMQTGFHPVDGYRFLCSLGFQELADTIVGHFSAPEEAALLGFGGAGLDVVRARDTLEAQLITYWDAQVLPGGRIVTFDERVQDILRRYGDESLQGKAVLACRKRVQDIIDRIDRLLLKIPS